MFVRSAKEVLIKTEVESARFDQRYPVNLAESEGEDAADPPHVFCGNAAP